jgi:Heparinase II/III-like protein/Heparinase II/III N-terminus
VTAAGLGWYVRRLRQMSAGEVGRRAVDVTRRRLWTRRQVRPGDPMPPAPQLRVDRAFGPPLPVGCREGVDAGAAAAVVAAADRVLAGEWEVFGVRRRDSADPDWFLDPVSGRRSPDRRFAFGINHRDEADTGNVKQVWEMSRHHHLTVLATAWWLTRDDRYAEAVAEQLRSWWRANPFLTGVHWTSGIEAGVRLLAWVWIRRLLDDWPKIGDLFEDDPDAQRQIAWHQEYLAAFPSRGSSANNHVIAEAAGLLAAASAFPWYAASPRWKRNAAALLERELAANTFSSGINRELASDYHRFVLELVLVAAVEAETHGIPLARETWQRIARMLDAGAALLDVAGNAPRQGDGDEGRALVVDDPEREPWAVVLGAGAAVLGAGDWWPCLERSVGASLLGALAAPRTLEPTLDRASERPSWFPDAGLALLRTPSEGGPEIWCRCDGGPHGFLSIAAHAHADALSLEVRHDGVEILADPGTYCYHGEPLWRQWFRSTAAHNTLEVAGVDQSESGGPFLWTAHARTTTLECRADAGSRQSWLARHDGYRHLQTPAAHRRAVALDGDRRRLEVVDTLEVAEPVPVRLSWHLGPDVRVDLDGATARLTWSHGSSAREATLTLPPELRWTAHRGEEEPPLGWYSPGFGQRVPTTSLIGTGELGPEGRLESTLAFDDATD